MLYKFITCELYAKNYYPCQNINDFIYYRDRWEGGSK